MILYGSSLSPFVCKVLAFAAEKSIELEVTPVAPGDPNPDFRAASPFGKMPALADGDFSLPDSSAIVHYLEALHPEPALIPSDPRQRGKVIWSTNSPTPSLAAAAPRFFSTASLRHAFGPAGRRKCGRRGRARRMPPIMDYLESVVPATMAIWSATSLTLADIAVASPVANLGHLGCHHDRARHGRPRLCRAHPRAPELQHRLGRTRSGLSGSYRRLSIGAKKTPRPPKERGVFIEPVGT